MTLKSCIDHLKEMKSIDFRFKKEKLKLLKHIEPYVLNIRDGSDVMNKIEEFVINDEYEKAIKILKSVWKSSKFWPISKITFSDLGGFQWVLIALSVVGIGTLIFGYSFKNIVEESVNWPKTSGFITKSYVIEDYVGEDGDLSYAPILEYNYSINGINYVSDKRTFVGLTHFQERKIAEEIVKRYSVGAFTDVYYNPKKHKQSVLEPVAKPDYIIIISGYLIFGLGFIILALNFFKEIRRIIRNDK